MLVAYGVWGGWRPALPDVTRLGWRMVVAVGAVTGVTAFTAVFVLPWVPYLRSLRLEKSAMGQVLGLCFTVATLALAVRLPVSPQMGWWSVPSGIAMCGALVGAFVGLKFGGRLHHPLSVQTIQRSLFLVFIVLGVTHLLRTG